MRLSTCLYTDSMFPVATIETHSETRQTLVIGGKMDGQAWDGTSPLNDIVARHRAVLNRVVRAETGMRLAYSPMDMLLEQQTAADGASPVSQKEGV